jgi:hypothetical protein
VLARIEKLRRSAARGCELFSSVEVVEHTDENAVDLTYIAGHLYSAISQAMVPVGRRPEFQSGLQRALRKHLAEGTLAERIDASSHRPAVDHIRSLSGS